MLHRNCRAAAAVLVATALADAIAPAGAEAISPRALHIVGDSLPAPLAAGGDPARGRALLIARENANCVLCHAVPDPQIPFAGDVGPSLAGVGARLSPAQIRLRVVDNTRVNPNTIMPSYYRIDGLDRVAPTYRGKPVLSAQEIEDIVAYLSTLR